MYDTSVIENDETIVNESQTGGTKSEEPQTINAAQVFGSEHEEMAALLETPVTFMTGKLYDQGDRRNTQAGGWKKNEFTWGQLVTADWSPLTNHPEAKAKQGDSIVIGETIDGNRNAESVKSLGAIVIDIDSGPTYEAVRNRLLELGIFATMYTSFNHNKTRVELKHDDVVRKLKLDDTPNRAEVLEYLRKHHKDRYDEEFLEGIEVDDFRHHGPKGLQIILRTPPLHKFRVIVPLAKPVELADLGTTAAQWKDAWAGIVTGFCVNTLGVSFDSTSADVNRLFYTARHPKDGEWDCSILMGRPLKIEEVESHSKNAYLNNREPMDPFAMAADLHDDDKPPQVLTPKGVVLNMLHSKIKGRLLISDLILSEAPDKVRREVSDGKIEIECPFEHEHSTEGGTGTVVMDPTINEHEVWTVSCPHDACQGRHKLEHLGEMLKEGWFDESLLVDDEYLLDADDKVIELDSAGVECAVEDILSADSTDAETAQFLRQYLDADTSTINRIIDRIANVTVLGKADVKKILKCLRDERVNEAKLQAVEKRKAQKQPDYTQLEAATEESVLHAASAANWLPPGFEYRNGWFGTIEYESQKFQRVCVAFEVVYSADGAKGATRTNQLTIRYSHRSPKEGIVESTFRIGDTYKDSGTILGTLRNEGLEFAPGAKTESILTLLRAISSDREAVYCAQAGWTPERDAYVSPTGRVAKHPENKRTYVLAQSMRVSDSARGDITDYYRANNIALRGKNAKFLAPGMLLGAVGCLAGFLGVENAVIVANEGKKNSGKTTSLKMGVSFCAVASAQGLIFSANSTETAFEAMAMKASGAAMAPDDSGAAKGTAEGEQRQIYQYANRMGRGRGTPTGGLQEINEWNGAMGISTERGLLTRLAAEDGDVKSGVQSRVFTVDFEGAEVLHKTSDAELLKAYDVLAHGAEPTVIGGVYGVAWEPFAHHLLKKGVESIAARVSEYQTWWSKNVVGGERVVKMAALMAVASEVCQECGLWPKNDYDIDWEDEPAMELHDGLNVQELIKQALVDTLSQRAGVLDSEKQATENLRIEIIRAVGRRAVINSKDSESALGDILGYWSGKVERFNEANLADRTYILPVDRLAKLGVNIEVGGLVAKLRDEGALVLPTGRSKFFKKGLWETMPNEGRVLNLRVSGAWVHGTE